MGLNKEAVAVIHYMDGSEKIAKVYSLNSMLQMIQHCDKKGFSYYVCLTKLDTIIPIRSHKPSQAFNTLMEYDCKVETPKRQQMAFVEATRIDRIHHPPNRNEVLKKYQGRE